MFLPPKSTHTIFLLFFFLYVFIVYQIGVQETVVRVAFMCPFCACTVFSVSCFALYYLWINSCNWHFAILVVSTFLVFDQQLYFCLFFKIGKSKFSEYYVIFHMDAKVRKGKVNWHLLLYQCSYWLFLCWSCVHGLFTG